MYYFILASLLLMLPQSTFADDGALYRALSLKVRTEGTFKVPLPDGRDMSFNYSAQIGSPILASPNSSSFKLTPDSNAEMVLFWDKISLNDGSYLQLGNDRVPLTCIYISGQDNRQLRADNPLFPEYVLRVYIVANDYTCTGPINPGWPSTGGRQEMWETYLYYEIRDPTIMLPTEVVLHYRRNQFESILVQ